MIEQLAKEYNISLERLQEMDLALSEYEHLFNEFSLLETLDYIDTILLDKFTDKERKFMIFTHGLLTGYKLQWNNSNHL